ncbi:MAG: L-rhamnose isomerase [Verrucomicrobia bacterium]|nr:L-rhamnose isomerase [Verrucomicrobiota bacterium]
MSALLASSPLFISTAAAESPPDRVWQAQWIGPALAPSIELADAAWIWSDEAGVDPARNAKPGSVFFRREILLPATAKVVAATARFSADNHFKLFVNGERGGGRDEWARPKTIQFAPSLRPGLNRILIQADNDGETTNAAGLIGKIRIELKGGAVQEIATDANWESAPTIDSPAWKTVKVIGKQGVAPWGDLQAPGNSVKASAVPDEPNQWNCYRKTFNLAKIPSTAFARIAVDSKYGLWVNGRMVVRERGNRWERVDYSSLRTAEKSGDLTTRLALLEEAKTLPFGAVRDEYSRRQNVPVGVSWLAEVRACEKAVLSNRSV